ncbi:MAG: hypothetical protein NVSMB4_16320 [Acidimicrobiales bacterium]
MPDARSPPVTSFGASTPSASFVVGDATGYELVVARSAVRAIAEVLPEQVAAAVLDLITGDLLAAPRRVGKPFRRELEGSWVARRGTFRVVYEIDDDNSEVVGLRVDHRNDIYRQR